MVIQHNIMALNSFRNQKINQTKLNKNLEKLSSGYKINRAGDNAAGLAISESMRALINGANQAGNNVEDGIGLIQTAEGAMQEIHSMLERAYQLSITSSNGTYSDSDRSNMQEELSQLLSEIDRIAKHTEFNEIQVLQGAASTKYDDNVKISVESKLPAWVQTDASMANGYLSVDYNTNESYKGTSYPITHASATLDFSALDATPPQANITDLIGKGFYTSCFTCGSHYSIEFTDDTSNSVETSGNHYIYKIGIKNPAITDAASLVQAIVDGTDSGNPNNHYTKFVANGSKLITYDDRSTKDSPITPADYSGWTGWDNPAFNINHNTCPDRGKFGSGVARSANNTTVTPGIDIILQIGASGAEILEVDLPFVTLEAMNITNVQIGTQKAAASATAALKSSIDYVSNERGRMGAYQQRLEHTNRSLAITAENLTSAESRIRDTDMADEITYYTKNNILLQAAQSMLAQANSTPQSILSLLQA